MSNATYSTPLNGFNFSVCKNVERLGHEILMSVCKPRLGEQFVEADGDLQEQGVDYILRLPSRDIWFEMKTEIHERNSFQEWLQLVVSNIFTNNPSRSYQFGGVQKTRSDVYLLVNVVSGYLIVVERRPWALNALRRGVREMENGRLILSAVLNTQEGKLNGQTVTRFSRVAYGAPIANAELAQQCQDEDGAFVRIFDIRDALNMGHPDYATNLAKVRYGSAEEKGREWALGALTRGAPDFENMARQFDIQPLETLPDCLLNLPEFSTNSRDTVREGGEVLMACAQYESKTTGRYKLAASAGVVYQPLDDEVAEYYGDGPRQFAPPVCSTPKHRKPQYQLTQEKRKT